MARVPAYRRHPNGQAFVYHQSIPTKDHRRYLGIYDSDESRRKYQQFLRRLDSTDPAMPELDGHDMTIHELVVKYLEFAERYYVRDGRPTGEASNVGEALRHLTDLWGDDLGRGIGPRHLKAVRDHLVAADYARGVVNARLGRIKRFFRWCCGEAGLLPARIHHELSCVRGLSPGLGGARDTEPVAPVSWEDACQVLPYVSPQVGAMIQVQYLCGMRPEEICMMRAKEVDRSGAVWLYRPEWHKGTRRGIVLIKAIPKRAQEILKLFLPSDPEAHIFNPRDAWAWYLDHREERRKAHRKTKLYPSELKARTRRKAERRRRGPVERLLGGHFTTNTYRRAVARGFDLAKAKGQEIPRWHPHQLRHGIATEVSAILGEQAAQHWLGHSHIKTTQRYIEKQVKELRAIADKLDAHWSGESQTT